MHQIPNESDCSKQHQIIHHRGVVISLLGNGGTGICSIAAVSGCSDVFMELFCQILQSNTSTCSTMTSRWPDEMAVHSPLLSPGTDHRKPYPPGCRTDSVLHRPFSVIQHKGESESEMIDWLSLLIVKDSPLQLWYWYYRVWVDLQAVYQESIKYKHP